MFGQIQLEDFVGLKNMPQKAQTAWDAVFKPDMVGVKFKPLIYAGSQEVNGILHWFITERTQPYHFEIRNVIKMAILEKNGEKGVEYSFDEKTISKIF